MGYHVEFVDPVRDYLERVDGLTDNDRAAVVDGRIYVRTERVSGKVKRLRRQPRALIAPCTRRGRALGAPLEATGRALESAEEPVAERAIRGRYGFGRALFERTMDILRVDMAYLEFVSLRDDSGG